MKEKKGFQMPSALTIVMIFLAVVGLMTWFIPTSVVVEEAGERIIHFNAAFDADGNLIENAGTNPVGLWDFFLAPIEGFISAALPLSSARLSAIWPAWSIHIPSAPRLPPSEMKICLWDQVFC